MANYLKATDFAAKDALLTGDPNKIVKGTEYNDEFDAIQTAVNSKANSSSPTFTGTPAAPTATAGVNTTQIATTAFVTAAVDAFVVQTADIANDAVTTAKIAPTGVAAGTYGSASTIPVVTVNAEGQVTSATTAAITIADPIGVGQTWQAVTRSLGTTYTNSTGRPIQVMVSMRGQGAGAAIAYVNGLEIARANSPDCCGVPQYPTVPFSFIVPNGNTYLCTGNGLSRWVELR